MLSFDVGDFQFQGFLSLPGQEVHSIFSIFQYIGSHLQHIKTLKPILCRQI